MSGKGNCYDHSMVVIFFKSITLGTLLRNILPCNARLNRRNRWDTRRQAEGAIFQYIDGFNNPRRCYSSLGRKSPMAFERKAT